MFQNNCTKAPQKQFCRTRLWLRLTYNIRKFNRRIVFTDHCFEFKITERSTQTMAYSRHNEKDMAIKMHYKTRLMKNCYTDSTISAERRSATTAKTIIATFTLRMRTDENVPMIYVCTGNDGKLGEKII